MNGIYQEARIISQQGSDLERLVINAFLQLNTEGHLTQHLNETNNNLLCNIYFYVQNACNVFSSSAFILSKHHSSKHTHFPQPASDWKNKYYSKEMMMVFSYETNITITI